MTVRDPFLFIAGAPALDFINTEAILRGERTDLLGDEHDLIRWIGEAGLGSVRARGKWLAEARALRASLRRTFVHRAGGGTLRPSDLAPLRKVLATGRGALELTLRDGQARLTFAPEGQPSPLFLIARNAAEFLVAADPALIKPCEGNGCILLFYDTTKSHTRRWCSMAACGNREKVTAHYRRRREQ